MFKVKPKTYPLKPKRPEGFKKAVAWFGGREFIASLKGVVMYAIYGENTDPRSWMKANVYPDDGGNADASQMTSAEVDRAWAEKIHRYWKWKHDNFKFWRAWLHEQTFWKKLDGSEKADGADALEEFWFDYIADSGDGQTGVYSVACLCLSDLWLAEEKIGARIDLTPANVEPASKLLPRGYFLFVGGDTAYHAASYETLFERFQTPFRWAFTSVRESLFRRDKNLYRPVTEADEIKFLFEGVETKVSEKPDQWDGTKISREGDKLFWDEEPPRPLFGIPANHDYYDSIEGFNRQFRRSPSRDAGENSMLEDNQGRIFLQIPTFSREQEASYVAVRLPFDWWFFGIDSENEKLDLRQEVFFRQIMENSPKKLILATPEPTTVFGRECAEEDKTTTYLKIITEKLGLRQPFLEKGQFKLIDETDSQKDEKLTGVCRLDLSGDIHHYARYWGPHEENSGKKKFASPHYASVVAGGGGAFFDTTSTLIGEAAGDDGRKLEGEIPPQKVYPDEGAAIARTAERLFDLWNIKNGGYIQHAGVVSAILIFFFLTQYSNVSAIFKDFEAFITDNGVFGALYSLWRHLTASSTYANLFETSRNVCAAIILLASLGLNWWATQRINGLIRKIKDKMLEAKVREDEPVNARDSEAELLRLGRIWQLFLTSIPFFAAVLLYAIFIFLYPSGGLRLEVRGFTNSLFLLLHVAAAVLMIWLSFEYTNWLIVKFKLNRRNPQKTFTEKLEDPNEDPNEFLNDAIATNDGFIFRILKKFALLKKLATYFLKLVGFFSRGYSYKYFPAIALVTLAVAALAFGIGKFGDEALGDTFADLLLVFFVVGEAYLLSYVLGSQTGAAYQDAKGKKLFFALGLWHAILQILTPFIVFRYASWQTALLIFAALILFNGFSGLMYLIEDFLPRKNTENTDERKKTDSKFPFGAWLMKYFGRKKSGASAWAFFVVWLALGAFVLVAPFTIFRSDPSFDALLEIGGNWVSQRSQDFSQQFSQRIEGFGGGTAESVFQFISSLVRKFGERSYLGFAFLMLGFIGYRLSRIWFSWYLGVSVLFNGHNNEAGGMARIEGFKHILRIKITRDLLTVYVIGLDEACDDLSKLKSARLVDLFHLKPSPPPENDDH